MLLYVEFNRSIWDHKVNEKLSCYVLFLQISHIYKQTRQDSFFYLLIVHANANQSQLAGMDRSTNHEIGNDRSN